MKTDNIKACLAAAAADEDVSPQVKAAAATEVLDIAGALIDGLSRLAIAVENYNNL